MELPYLYSCLQNASFIGKIRSYVYFFKNFQDFYNLHNVTARLSQNLEYILIHLSKLLEINESREIKLY